MTSRCLDDIADFCIGLQLPDRKFWRGEKKPLIDFSPQVNAIRQNFVVKLQDLSSKDEFMERMGRCCEVLEEVDQTLDAMNFEDDKFRKRISCGIRKDAHWLKNLSSNSSLGVNTHLLSACGSYFLSDSDAIPSKIPTTCTQNLSISTSTGITRQVRNH